MYYLGIDFGGGSSKATLIDEKGVVIATASNEYVTTYGSDGMATQKPKDWYFSAIENIKSILKNGINAKEIACICFSAATHTAVLLDENDEVVDDSIYWTDTRSTKEKEFLIKNYKEYIFEKCKHLPDTIWTLPELMYLFNNKKELFNKTKHVLFAKDYVRHMFCEGYVTDYIEAEGSMLFDFDKNEWDTKLLNLAGLDISKMPKIVRPTDFVGNVSEKASKESGLSTTTKVICGSTDTAMEVFAAGGVKEGDMTIKLATAGRICLVSKMAFPDKHIINYSHLIDGLYYPGSGTKSCAASLRWYRDTFGGSYKEFDKLVEATPLGSDGLFFHPYLIGELTPLANPDVRASYFGISSTHTKGHFLRALYEGVGYSLLDCFNYLKVKGLSVGNKAYILGGGAKGKIWKQIVSDILNVELMSCENNDSSYGGSLTAAVACGVFKSFEEASERTLKVIEVTKPNKENHEKYIQLHKKYQEITDFTIRFYEKQD